MRIGKDIGETECATLVQMKVKGEGKLIPYCIQNDVTTQCLSWDVGLKKPRSLLLSVFSEKERKKRKKISDGVISIP